MVTYSEIGEEVYGKLFIEHLVLPHQNFDPLARIWSGIRKRINEQYKVDVVGFFLYKDSEKLIECSFYPNFAFIKKNTQVNDRIYSQRFQDTFHQQMMMLEETLTAFMDDRENGIAAYTALCQKPNTTEKDFKNLFNRFMESINMRTASDKKRSQRKEKINQFVGAINAAAKSALPYC